MMMMMDDDAEDEDEDDDDPADPLLKGGRRTTRQRDKFRHWPLPGGPRWLPPVCNPYRDTVTGCIGCLSYGGIGIVRRSLSA